MVVCLVGRPIDVGRPVLLAGQKARQARGQALARSSALSFPEFEVVLVLQISSNKRVGSLVSGIRSQIYQQYPPMHPRIN
jgi:hypothetical protein